MSYDLVHQPLRPLMNPPPPLSLCTALHRLEVQINHHQFVSSETQSSLQELLMLGVKGGGAGGRGQTKLHTFKWRFGVLFSPAAVSSVTGCI